MAKFNRNIITQADANTLAAATTPGALPKSLAERPPAGFTALVATATGGTAPTPATAAAGAAPGGITPPTEDDYLTKLLKYVPLEVVGAYLFLAGVIDSNVTQPHDHAWWLGGLLVGVLVLTIPYDIRVLGVVRAKQIAISVVGLAVYIFAVGGWFATTTWYHQWYASIALPIFGLGVAIVKLKPLPTGS